MAGAAGRSTLTPGIDYMATTPAPPLPRVSALSNGCRTYRRPHAPGVLRRVHHVELTSRGRGRAF
jgi:hypothetical protein